MKPFISHTGLAVPLDRANVDTDQIIPKQFCARVDRNGYEGAMFYNWRFQGGGVPNPAFILNEPRYQGASVLIAAKNFGSGSSREHAVWALWDYGFRTILAPSFGDIFYNNSTKNGLLPVRLPEETIRTLMDRALTVPGYQVTVDLNQCLVSDSQGLEAPFSIDSFRRQCLLGGLDDIGLTLQHEAKIAAYEAQRQQVG